MKKTWQPLSWRKFPCDQEVSYPDAARLHHIVGELNQLPPLVTPLEIENLKQHLAKASQGKCFLLQGGDCAESFALCRPENILNKLKILLQMSLVLIHGLRKPVIRVGRIAGQYAKPRSQPTETQNGLTLPTYRGDLINKQDFNPEARTPDPQLMLTGYSNAAITLNYIRALVDGGFADLQHPEYWDLGFVKHSPFSKEYRGIVKSIGDSLSFIKTISGLQASSLHRVDFYTSHEALNLYYEEALTRKVAANKWYDLSTHFPWLGMRTANLKGAHVEFFRGIKNPIAIKVGPSMRPESLEALAEILNPQRESGRLTFIMRLGAKQVGQLLPKFIETINKAAIPVLWSCDPMHGNTETTTQGIKTRHFDDILNELKDNFRIHHEMGTHLGGVHFELTGEDVTECMGGARGISEADLERAYESLVDPRLNYEQALEMALLITRNH